VTKLTETGVLGGIIAGGIAAYMFNRFYRIQLPDYLGFFAGKRFVPIVTGFAAILAGTVMAFIWPPIGEQSKPSPIGLLIKTLNWLSVSTVLSSVP